MCLSAVLYISGPLSPAVCVCTRCACVCACLPLPVRVRVCEVCVCVRSACTLACLHVRWALLPHTMPKTCNSAGPGKVYGGPRLPCLGIAGPWAWPWEARRASRGGHCRPGPSRCRLLTGPCPLGCQWEAARNPTRWAWCAPMAS